MTMGLFDFLRPREQRDDAVADNTWLVIGLGNPGAQYEGNRHNVGQMVADELASRIGATFKSHKTNSRVAEGFLRPGGPKLVIAKPNSYMNTSGGPVSALVKYYAIPVERLIDTLTTPTADELAGLTRLTLLLRGMVADRIVYDDSHQATF